MVLRSRVWLTSLRFNSAMTSTFSSNRTPSSPRSVQAILPAARCPLASSIEALSPSAGESSLLTVAPSAEILRISQFCRRPEW